ncbi:MAG: dihydroorotate dehydrogenase [Dehalococcoidales bacterium]|nr:dihydroorotate dehydrogenase [Dehalococcoidales bacterium]
MDLSVQLAPKNKKGLLLSNPVMPASGTFGYGMEFEKIFDIQKLGAIVCKGTTLQSRIGNKQPRIAETAGGMLNSIGLQNVGVDSLIRDIAPVWAKWQVPVIVNMAGATFEEYGEVARRLDNVKGIAAIELNISCPNVAEGGAEFGARVESATAVTKIVRKSTSLPLIVKLTPNTADVVRIAQSVVAEGADALCLINTLKGAAVDIKKRKLLLGNGYGGLSGPAIKPVALYMVHLVAGVVDVPIIGCGGIVTGLDAIEFFMAGASAVQVGTAHFANPIASLDVLEGIKTYLKAQKIEDFKELVGTARK